MEINYDNRVFRTVENTGNGEVSGETVFFYHQDREAVWAEYSGGAVKKGVLVARVESGGTLEMRYSHLNTSGVLMTGCCRSAPEVLPDGRVRLHESWTWTSGNGTSGTSIIEQIEPGDA